MKRVLLSVIVVIAVATQLFAQEKRAKKGTFKGVVIDSLQNFPLPGVEILMGEDGLVAATDTLGGFTINSFEDSTINIQLSYYGYKEKNLSFIVRKGGVDTIKLAVDEIAFDDIMIEGQPELMVQVDDTTQYNVASLSKSEDTTVEDLIKRLPGFEYVDGKLMHNGKEVKKIYIDGKPHFLNSNVDVLQQLPASLLSKIKMFDERSEDAKFSGIDDGKRDKTLNLVTKHPNKMKMFGNINTRYDIPEDNDKLIENGSYSVGASVNMMNNKLRITSNANIVNSTQSNKLSESRYDGEGGNNNSENIGVNISRYSKKTQLNANYNFRNGDNYNADRFIQDYYPSESFESRIYDSESHSWNNSGYHNLGVDFRYEFSDKNQLYFNTHFTLNDRDTRSINYVTNIENQDTVNNNISSNNTISDGITASVNLGWRYAFKKIGRTLMTNFDYRYSDNNSIKRQVVDETIYSEEGKELSLRNNLTNSESNNASYSAGITYSEPLTEKSQTGLTYNINNSVSDNNNNTSTYKDALFTDLIGVDSSLTTISDYYQTNQSIALFYNANLKDKFYLNIGMSADYSEMTNKYDYLDRDDNEVYNEYLNFAPRAYFNYAISKTSRLNLSYNGGTTSPSISQLDATLDIDDPLYITRGNPNLDKSFNHTVNLDYNGSHGGEKISTHYSASINMSQVFNSIESNVVFIEQDTVIDGYTVSRGARFSSPLNLGSGFGFGANLNGSFQIKKLKSGLNFSVDYRYSEDPAIYNNITTTNTSEGTSYRVSLNSYFIKNIDFGISYNYRNSTSVNSDGDKSRLYSSNINSNFSWRFMKRFRIGSSLNYSNYTNVRTESVTEENMILNAHIAVSFLKQNRAELEIRADDILRQQNSVNYILSEFYSQYSYSTYIENYFTVTFRYRFNNIRRLAA